MSRTAAVGAGRSSPRPRGRARRRRRRPRAAAGGGPRRRAPRGRARTRADALQPPVLLDAGLGEDAAGAHGLFGQCAQRLVLGRRRRVELCPRDHPLGQVVDPLEALAAGDHEVAVVPQPLQHRLRRLPVPHPAAGGALEVAGRGARRARGSRPGSRRRGAGACGRRRRTSRGRRSPSPAGRAATTRSAAGRPRAPSTRRSSPRRGDPRPRPRVVADAARERDPVAALDGRDRVQLDAGEPPDRGLDVGLGRAAVTRRVSLRRDGKPADCRRAHQFRHRDAQSTFLEFVREHVPEPPPGCSTWAAAPAS